MNNALIAHIAKKDVLLDLKIKYYKQQLANATRRESPIQSILPVIQSTANAQFNPSNFVVVPSYTTKEVSPVSACNVSVSGPTNPIQTAEFTDSSFSAVLPQTMTSYLPTVGTILGMRDTTSEQSTADRSFLSLALSKR